jgi:hypothetical protein
MARIYISSTYADLQKERDLAYRTLRGLGHDVVAHCTRQNQIGYS